MRLKPKRKYIVVAPTGAIYLKIAHVMVSEYEDIDFYFSKLKKKLTNQHGLDPFDKLLMRGEYRILAVYEDYEEAKRHQEYYNKSVPPVPGSERICKKALKKTPIKPTKVFKIIYVTCILNDRVYVTTHTSVEASKIQLLKLAKNSVENMRTRSHFYNDLMSFGIDSFSFKVVAKINGSDEATKEKNKHVRRLKETGIGYNQRLSNK